MTQGTARGGSRDSDSPSLCRATLFAITAQISRKDSHNASKALNGDSPPNFTGAVSPEPHFAGIPDMFLPRVPPHTPVTVGRQKHIGPAKCLSCDPTPLDVQKVADNRLEPLTTVPPPLAVNKVRYNRIQRPRCRIGDRHAWR